MSRLEKKLKQLLTVGDVGLYRTFDGGYGVSVDFYDKSYGLSHPSDTLKEAVNEMRDDWMIKAQLSKPEWLKKAYKKHCEELKNSQWVMHDDLYNPPKERGSKSSKQTPNKPSEDK